MVEIHHFVSVVVLVRHHNFDLLQRRRFRGDISRNRGSKFSAEDSAQEWVAALSLPFTAVALVGLALGLYLITPENYLTVRQALPGAILFSIGWLVVTKLFQLYVAKYDRYNPTYHALASIIVLLTWMYLTCLLLLLGGKLNAILRLEHERAVENRAPEPQPA